MPAVGRQVRMMRRRGMPTPGRVQPARGPDARSVAHEVLVRVETTDAFADVLLAPRPERRRAADRALATELVYGTLAWQGRLDHHLAGLVRGSRRAARAAGPRGARGSASTSSSSSIAFPRTPRSTRASGSRAAPRRGAAGS